MLKKTFLTFLFVLSLSVSVTAQDLGSVDNEEFSADEVVTTNKGDEPPFVLKPYVLSIGPKFGFNYSLAKDPDGIDLGVSGSEGFLAGIQVNIRFARPEGRPLGTESFGMQFEALYSTRALNTDAKNINMKCYDIPVLFQWYFLPKFALEIGPTFTGVFSASPKELKYNNTIYQFEKVKAHDVMLTIGATYKGKPGSYIDLRYNMGNSDLAGNFKTKVSTLSISIGWLFNVIK